MFSIGGSLTLVCNAVVSLNIVVSPGFSFVNKYRLLQKYDNKNGIYSGASYISIFRVVHKIDLACLM